MALTYYTYQEYKYLLDDPMIEKAINLLESRRKEFCEWIEENDPLKVCPECSSENTGYRWNKRLCNDCGYEEDYEVPPPAKGGKTNSRTLCSIIKELFGREMGRAKIEEKPSKAQLENLPIDLARFDTGEYTRAEAEFLSKRYKDLLDEVDAREGTDEFMFHLLVMQELKLKQIYRQEAISRKLDDKQSLAKKREISVYTDLAENLKASKSTREENQEKHILDELMDSMEGEDVEEIVEEYKKQKEKEREELEKSKARRLEAGNRW
ncbi:MAG: hypothetical protein ACOCRK_02595 [bacterium]